MKSILLFCLFASLQFYSQLGNYDQNGAVEISGQRSWATIEHFPKEVASSKEFAAVLGVLLAPMIDIGVSVVKEKSKQSILKYTNTFNINVSDSNFWIDSKNVNLPILTINREIVLLKDSQKETALKIKLIPELSPDKTAFRFRFDNSSFLYKYSSAKTKNKYNYIDIKLDIIFKTLTLTNGQYEIKDLRATNVIIPMTKVGEPQSISSSKIFSGWIPLVPIPSLSLETTVSEKEIKDISNLSKKEGKSIVDTLQTTTIIQKFNGIAKQKIVKNSGLYEIEVTVTEFNPYKVKSENIQKLIESS
ncbi:hypothetical protein, partial [Chryseobacterium arthrosphaerae]